MRSRLFLLEEENSSLKREAELELPREVESLKHQVSWSSFLSPRRHRNCMYRRKRHPEEGVAPSKLGPRSYPFRPTLFTAVCPSTSTFTPVVTLRASFLRVPPRTYSRLGFLFCQSCFPCALLHFVSAPNQALQP